MSIVVYFKLMCDHLVYCHQPRFTQLFIQYLITKFYYSCFSDAIQSLLLLLPVIGSKSVTFQQKNHILHLILHHNFRHNWKVIKRISPNIKFTTGVTCAIYHSTHGCAHIVFHLFLLYYRQRSPFRLSNYLHRYAILSIDTSNNA